MLRVCVVCTNLCACKIKTKNKMTEKKTLFQVLGHHIQNEIQHTAEYEIGMVFFLPFWQTIECWTFLQAKRKFFVRHMKAHRHINVMWHSDIDKPIAISCYIWNENWTKLRQNIAHLRMHSVVFTHARMKWLLRIKSIIHRQIESVYVSKMTFCLLFCIINCNHFRDVKYFHENSYLPKSSSGW